MQTGGYRTRRRRCNQIAGLSQSRKGPELKLSHSNQAPSISTACFWAERPVQKVGLSFSPCQLDLIGIQRALEWTEVLKPVSLKAKAC